jgi:RNA polymerase sigma factor (TIGR02999 family)
VPTSPDRPSDVTQLLVAWGHGDRSGTEELLSAVYAQLRRQAAAAMRHENEGHTLQPTALVNEAWIRLVDQREVDWKNRAQFFGVAARMMRRVLIDHARERQAEKRGGGVIPLTLSGVDAAPSSDGSIDVCALHEALERLAVFDPDQARIVELRYFGGLSIEETAALMECSPRTIKREWAIARAWLKRELAP